MKLIEFKKENFNLYLDLATSFHMGPASFTEPDSEIFKRNFNHILIENDAFGYFVYEGEKIAGYLLCSLMFSTEVGGLSLWLEELSILPEFQGEGLGSKTIELLLEMFPKIKRFRLEVAPSNEKAKSLYERLGYNFLRYEQMIYDRE